MSNLSKDINVSEDEVLNTTSNSSKNVLGVEKKRWRIIQYVKEHPNCTIYSVAKGLDFNYSTVHSALRELVFARVLALKSGLDSGGQPCELFFVPEESNE